MTNPSLQNVNHGGSASFSIFYIFSKPTCQRYGWWCKDAHFDPPVIKHGNGNRPCIVFIYIFSFKCPCKEISHCHVWLHESINLDGLSQIGTGLQVILPQLEIEITCCKWWRVTYMRVIIWSYLNLNIFKINPTERSHERIAFMWGVARTWAMHGYALFLDASYMEY